MPSHETIDLTTDGPAARILLNRPDALNAWNEQFGKDLHDAVTTVAGDDSVRAVMITGAGRGFSSGADLKEQRGSDDGGLPDLSARLKEIYHPIITRCARCRSRWCPPSTGRRSESAARSPSPPI